jgi:hypothetical protein
MTRPHYTPTGEPRKKLFGSSQRLRDEFKLIEDGIAEMSKWPITIIMEDLTDETKPAWFTVPWACRIGSIVAIPDTDVDVGGSVWTRVSHGYSANRVNWLSPGTFSGSTLHYINSGSPAGTPYSAPAFGDGTEEFTEGELIKLESASGGATLTSAHVTFHLERMS